MFGDLALLAKPRIHYWGSSPETEFFIKAQSVTLKIEHRLHGSGTGVSCWVRSINPFLLGEGHRWRAAPDQRLELLVSWGKKRDHVHHDMEMAPSHWEGLAQDFLPLLACIRGSFVIIIDEFLHGSSAQEKLCLECSVVVTWFFLILLLITLRFACTSIIGSPTSNFYSVKGKKREVAKSSRWVYSDCNILLSIVNISLY